MVTIQSRAARAVGGRTRKGGTRERMRPHAQAAADLLRALGNEQRLLVLCMLADAEMTVGELNAALPLSQSALSQHLAVLRESGIVDTRKEGQSVYYSMRRGPAAQVVATLHSIYCG